MITLVRKVRNKQASPRASSKPSRPPCEHRTAQNVNPTSSDLSDLREQDILSEPAGNQNVPAGAKCAVCKDEKRAARKYRWKVILGLIFPYALQALDVTIIASALPWIAVDFGEVPQLNWIISAFNLTSAAFIPFWGQMADIFGRHYSLQASVFLMMIGSALCTGAPTNAFPVLLLGRGFQGLGCAGLSLIVMVILADKVSLKENAKNRSIFAFTGGISYGIGPVIGGYLTNTDWRWCFAINLPIAVAAILLILILLRKELLGPQPILVEDGLENPDHLEVFSKRIKTVDAGGQLLFLFGFGLVTLALTWAGATYSWDSAYVLAPLCVGTTLIGAFICWERLMAPGRVLALNWPHQKPMFPWELIIDRDVGLLFYITFATGAAMYAVLYFVNIYFTVVKGFKPSQAGIQLLYYTPGIGVGVYASMYMCNVYPKKTFVPIMLGSVIEAVGVGVLAWALTIEHTPTIFGMMALTGAGTGLRFMPGPLHVVGLFPKHIATVVSLMTVALPFGGTVALTVMSTVFNNTSGIGRNSSFRDFTTLSQVPEPLKSQIIHQAKMGVVWAFVAITPFMLLCIIAALFLGNVNITKDRLDEDGQRGVRNVVRESYLLSLWRRRRGARVDAENEPKAEEKNVT